MKTGMLVLATYVVLATALIGCGAPKGGENVEGGVFVRGRPFPPTRGNAKLEAQLPIRDLPNDARVRERGGKEASRAAGMAVALFHRAASSIPGE